MSVGRINNRLIMVPILQNFTETFLEHFLDYSECGALLNIMSAC